jgi:glutathione S-transferase
LRADAGIAATHSSWQLESTNRQETREKNMLKLWGRISSINVRKVVFAAQLLELPFERIDAGASIRRRAHARLPGAQPERAGAAAGRRRLHALGVERDRALPLRAHSAPASLYPHELRARFDAERWMDWQQTTLNPPAATPSCSVPHAAGAQRSQARDRRFGAATEPLLAMLDAHLARALHGRRRLTMADMPIACELHRWWGLPLPSFRRASRTCAAGTRHAGPARRARRPRRSLS